MEFRIEHNLALDEVATRIASLSIDHAIEHTPDAGGTSGGLSKTTGLGAVAARYQIEADALVIQVTSRPAFLPEGMVRRALEENLRDALASR